MNEDTFYKAIRNYQWSSVPIDPTVFDWVKDKAGHALVLGSTTKTRIPDAEHIILDALRQNIDSNFFTRAVEYCIHALNGRWQELEDIILKNNNSLQIVLYTQKVVKHRWKEAESHLSSPQSVVDYAISVIKGPWPEKEHIIITDPPSIFKYAMGIGRWSEGEKVLISKDYADKSTIICNYAKHVVHGRWKEAEEQYLNKKPYGALLYAIEVIEGRWIEAESVIAQNAGAAFSYAENILKGAFPEAEKTLFSSHLYYDYFVLANNSSKILAEKLEHFDPKMTVAEVLSQINCGRNKDFEEKLLNSTHNQRKAVWYSANVLKNRWPEAEKAILRSPKACYEYAKDVIKGRWVEAEKTIAKDIHYLALYAKEVVKGQLPNSFHNILVAERIKGNTMVDTYFEMFDQMGG